jgi:hypothetical protein
MVNPQDQTDKEWLKDYGGKKAGPETAQSTPEKRSITPQAVSSIGKKRERFQPKKSAPKIVAPDDLPVLIPERAYEAKCCEYKFTDYRGTSKLVVKFEISEGQYAGVHLEAFYNLPRQKEEGGEDIITPSKRGAYLRTMNNLFGDVRQAGGDWLSPDNLLEKSFRVEVQTVTSNYSKEALGCNQYSKIKTNIELIHE